MGRFANKTNAELIEILKHIVFDADDPQGVLDNQLIDVIDEIERRLVLKEKSL